MNKILPKLNRMLKKLFCAVIIAAMPMIGMLLADAGIVAGGTVHSGDVWLSRVTIVREFVPVETSALTTSDMAVGAYVQFGTYDANKDGTNQADEKILWRVINIASGQHCCMARKYCA